MSLLNWAILIGYIRSCWMYLEALLLEKFQYFGASVKFAALIHEYIAIEGGICTRAICSEEVA